MSVSSRSFHQPELTSALQLLCLAQLGFPEMSSGCLQSSSKSSSGSGLCFPICGLGALKSCGLGQSSTLVSGSTSSSSLGILEGANLGCVTQAPPSEVVICPAPIVVTLPGPILSTSCEPVRVGGYSACGGGGGKQSVICSRSCS